MGCDYTNSIKGVGPKRAIELIKSHRSLEKIVDSIDTKKYPIPEDWNFKQARILFQEPEVADPDQIEVKNILLEFSLRNILIQSLFRKVEL